jgi:hypothetical protein
VGGIANLKRLAVLTENPSRNFAASLMSNGLIYGPTSNNMMPTVNAIITPMTIAFDAISVDRITAEIMEIAAVAAISIAGAITHGISCVNHVRVCISFPPFTSSAERGCQITPIINVF